MNSYKERETEMGDCLRFLILWEISCTTNKAMFGLGMNVRTVELWQVRTMDVAGSWGGIKEKYRFGLVSTCDLCYPVYNKRWK